MPIDRDTQDALDALRSERDAALGGLADGIARGDERLDRVGELLRSGRLENGDSLVSALAAAAGVSPGDLLEFIRWGVRERAKLGGR